MSAPVPVDVEVGDGPGALRRTPSLPVPDRSSAVRSRAAGSPARPVVGADVCSTGEARRSRRPRRETGAQTSHPGRAWRRSRRRPTTRARAADCRDAAAQQSRRRRCRLQCGCLSQRCRGSSPEPSGCADCAGPARQDDGDAASPWTAPVSDWTRSARTTARRSHRIAGLTLRLRPPVRLVDRHRSGAGHHGRKPGQDLGARRESAGRDRRGRADARPGGTDRAEQAGDPGPRRADRAEPGPGQQREVLAAHVLRLRPGPARAAASKVPSCLSCRTPTTVGPRQLAPDLRAGLVPAGTIGLQGRPRLEHRLSRPAGRDSEHLADRGVVQVGELAQEQCLSRPRRQLADAVEHRGKFFPYLDGRATAPGWRVPARCRSARSSGDADA